jgi:hypothetical protein
MATLNQIEVKKFITPDIKKRMTGWEKEFISSLYNRKETWSEKQVEVFNKIKIKYVLTERVVVEKVIYAPSGYASGAKVYQQITSKQYRKNRSTGTKKP